METSFNYKGRVFPIYLGICKQVSFLLQYWHYTGQMGNLVWWILVFKKFYRYNYYFLSCFLSFMMSNPNRCSWWVANKRHSPEELGLLFSTCCRLRTWECLLKCPERISEVSLCGAGLHSVSWWRGSSVVPDSHLSTQDQQLEVSSPNSAMTA